MSSEVATCVEVEDLGPYPTFHYHSLKELTSVDFDGNGSAEALVGLRYLPGYICREVHDDLLAAIDREKWSHQLRRRVQHYGYRYPYRGGRRRKLVALGSLPEWGERLARKLQQDGHFDEVPTQLIVNEYLPGQGISPHVDSERHFGETIASLSLGSSCVMVFQKLRTRLEIALLLEPCSLLVLQGDARHRWRHCIKGRREDRHAGELHARGRRVSLTFRTVLPDAT